MEGGAVVPVAGWVGVEYKGRVVAGRGRMDEGVITTGVVVHGDDCRRAILPDLGPTPMSFGVASRVWGVSGAASCIAAVFAVEVAAAVVAAAV